MERICNQALLDTRGAAIVIVRFDLRYSKLTYIGIGNVMGVFWCIDKNNKLKRKPLFLEAGILGSRVPPSMKVKEAFMSSGDIFILATDGIHNQFECEPPKWELPEDIAKKIFTTYRDKRDDGLVLVVQLLDEIREKL